jgi:hypothetical protein
LVSWRIGEFMVRDIISLAVATAIGIGSLTHGVSGV